MEFDAVMVLSFGGPDEPADVIPFLENVLRGRPVPPERIPTIASRYMEFGGRSPINQQNRELVAALADALAARGSPLPVYWGNRNWHPFLTDTVADMRDAQVQRAAVFVTSAYSSYSGCGQYRQEMEAACRTVGEGAPRLVKLPAFFDRRGFVAPLAEGLRAALSGTGGDSPVLMSAHSIPSSMAATCDYEKQLRTTAATVASGAGLGPDGWSLVFQSRSGPPTQPWLEPDVVAAIESLPSDTESAVIVPIGFVSDHMEVIYDLDKLAVEAGQARGLVVYRTPTPGTHPAFVEMICDLVEEATYSEPSCPIGCCSAPSR